MPEPMVELRQVSKRFGSFIAVHQIDLQIRSGEFLTMLGPSGCGKTTVLRMISGFEHPTEGTVLLAGEDVTHAPPYRRNVNQVFQSYALFPHLSVRDNIAFGPRLQKLPRPEMEDRVQQAIDLVSLQGFEDRRPMQLSGGQKQRVALARAIVCRPKVLLLDEPLAALDAKLRKSMQVELKSLQARLGITFVFVTHDQEEALTMSDRIAVINHGRLEQLGTVDDIYHRPRTSFVANFIGHSNLLPCRVIDRTGDLAHVEVEGGIRFMVNAASLPAGASAALISIRPEKIQIAKNPSGTQNVFAATVQMELFKGAMDQLMLTTDAGLQLTATVANRSALDETFRKNDKVFCHVLPDDIVFVQPDPK